LDREIVMLLESLLAYVHIVAILALVVFLTSEAALCRVEWMNAAVVHRLLRVDLLYLVAAVAVLVTGVARTYWGAKGFGWYWSQPLLHLKVGLFVVIGLLSAMPTRAFFRWKRTLAASGTLPSAEEVKRARRWIMIEAHALVLVPLAATLLARGVGTR
jgi:putative membrane protein